MKFALLLSLAAIPLLAAETQKFDLPNGSRIIIEDGKVRVEAGRDGAASSSSSSVNVSSVNGKTVATVTSERNGKRETRKIVIGPDGKASISGAEGGEESPEPAAGGPWIGINAGDLPPALRAQLDLPDSDGVLVNHIAPGGPADKAGMVANDILLSIERKPIGSVEEMRAKLAVHKQGDKVTVEYLRKGRRASVDVTLASRVSGEGTGVNAAMEKLREDQPANTKSKTTIVGPGGKAKVVEGGGDDAFDALLNDPNVPDSFKENVRRQRDAMRKFREQHGGIPKKKDGGI